MTAAAATARAVDGWQTLPGALGERLTAAIQQGLLDGRLALGTRLPSERALSAELGVSRTTVRGAYARLRDDGWLDTSRGSGSVARLPPALRDGASPVETVAPAGAIDLRRAAVAAPAEAYQRAARAALDRLTPDLVSASPARGRAGLREALARRYTDEGTPTTPDEILITTGAVPGLWLALAALCAGAPRAIVETPTYPVALKTLRHRRASLIAWPVADGWDVAQFERLARERRANVAYLVPDFHNPTGRVMPEAVRRPLREIAARRELVLIVDETMREIDLRDTPRPLPGGLRGEGVVTLGSFSKSVWDALRVGWIRADAATIERLMAFPLASLCDAATLDQAIAELLLAELPAILDARRATLRARREHALAAVAAHAALAVAAEPLGGLSLWCRLTHGSSARLTVEAARHGVLLDPGGRYATGGELDAYLRLPLTAGEQQIDAALQRVAAIMR